MEDKVSPVADSGDDEQETPERVFAPLKALEEALNQIIHVKTSLMKLPRKDGSSSQLVTIDGTADEKTLEILEESVSDLIGSSESHERAPSLGSTSFQLRSPLNAATRESAAIETRDEGSERSTPTTITSDSFYSIPSCGSSFEGIIEEDSLKKAEEVIKDLERNGPAGLVHLSSLSAAIGKPIRVWSSGTENSRKVGRTRSGEPIDVEYHDPGPDDPLGHWTLRGNAEPRDDVEGQLNDCLFSVVADQIGRLAPELRARTVTRMRENIRSLAHRIDEIAKREKCDRISLLVGGARYTGERPQDAAKVIDASQRGRCHPKGLQGHPRGHASHPKATGPTESVENYSRGDWKTGFLSREDQDAVAHLILETPQAQQAMQQLNCGAINVALTLRPADIGGALPEAAEFVDGAQQGAPFNIRSFVIVLRHHLGQQDNPEADVFVHTLYPKRSG